MLSLAGALAWTGRHTLLGRGSTRRAMVNIARMFANGRPIMTAFRGVPIIAYPDTFKPVFCMAYDRPEMNFLLGYLCLPDAVFVDIGANFGIYSQWLGSKMAPTAKLVAIEPLMAGRLRNNLSLLNRKPDITIFDCAVSDSDGYVNFQHGRVSLAGPQMRARPLLDLVLEAGCERISALKIDIEGYEDRALLPFFRFAPESLWPDAIVIEHVHADDWNEDVVAALCGRGYKIVKKTRANLLMSRIPR